MYQLQAYKRKCTGGNFAGKPCANREFDSNERPNDLWVRKGNYIHGLEHVKKHSTEAQTGKEEKLQMMKHNGKSTDLKARIHN